MEEKADFPNSRPEPFQQSWKLTKTKAYFFVKTKKRKLMVLGPKSALQYVHNKLKKLKEMFQKSSRIYPNDANNWRCLKKYVTFVIVIL